MTDNWLLRMYYEYQLPFLGYKYIPILYTSQYRALATEKAASWLSKHFTYWWLEQNNHDRTLIDTDGL